VHLETIPAWCLSNVAGVSINLGGYDNTIGSLGGGGSLGGNVIFGRGNANGGWKRNEYHLCRKYYGIRFVYQNRDWDNDVHGNFNLYGSDDDYGGNVAVGRWNNERFNCELG